MATEDKARFSKEKHEYQMTPYAGQWKGMRAKKDPNAPVLSWPCWKIEGPQNGP